MGEWEAEGEAEGEEVRVRVLKGVLVAVRAGDTVPPWASFTVGVERREKEMLVETEEEAES